MSQLNLAQNELNEFEGYYQDYFDNGMRAKLGIFNKQAEDIVLIKNLLQLMQEFSADYSNTFKALTLEKLNDDKMFKSPHFQYWHEKWLVRVHGQNKSRDEMQALMKSQNPAIIPRNFLVEEALAAAENNDYSVAKKLISALKNPYDYSPSQEEFSKINPLSNCNCNYKTFCGT